MIVEQSRDKAVARWLIAGVAMIVVQTLLGGVTRLTGSGLSITEWKPIMGALPPLNGQEWDAAFDGYKQTGQYQMLNSHFTLGDFKFIFFWEWFHRLWARSLGVVFAIGFIYFLLKGYLHRRMVRPFIVLFLLGALQGAIGWIMVASGLDTSHLYVNHIKLSMHFVAAMVLACYTLWFALQLLVTEDRRATSSKLLYATVSILALLFVQLTYGAFMAGLKAALSAPTWPDINGMWWPDSLNQDSWVHNKINVHFVHRGLAYILLMSICYWLYVARQVASQQANTLLRHTYAYPVVLVFSQVVLGIVAVISATSIVPGHFATFEVLAEFHQMVAMFLLLALVVNLYVVKKSR